ncbi:unnamed protein product, partial [Iphiclides podalirius]
MNERNERSRTLPPDSVPFSPSPSELLSEILLRPCYNLKRVECSEYYIGDHKFANVLSNIYIGYSLKKVSERSMLEKEIRGVIYYQ